jgi:6-phosphogluconolactonase
MICKALLRFREASAKQSLGGWGLKLTFETPSLFNTMKISLIPLSLVLLPFLFSLTGCNEKTRLVACSYTETGNPGLSVYNFNSDNGSLQLLSQSDAGTDPSFFCFSKRRRLIYVINEVSEFNGAKGGGLTTLKYDRSFRIIDKIREIPVPDGGPCFVSLTPGNDYLLIANYTGGSAAVVKLDNDGIPIKICDTIFYKKQGEKISHAHMISSDPQGRRIYVTDLGLDRIMIYTLNNSSGKLIPYNEDGIPLSPGSGPRHFVFSKDGSVMYVIGELNSTISTYKVDDIKGLIHIQTVSTLREGFAASNSSADIHIGKSGDYLYGSNRGENTIVTFRILRNGQLSLAGHTDCGGNWPRNFVIDPSGKYILVGNQRSDDISVFRIDDKTGLPVKTGNNNKISAPACLKFINTY